MTKTDPQSLLRLRTLLHDVARLPEQAAAELAAERRRVAGDGPIAHEQLAIELRWLSRRPEARDPGFGPAAAEARREWLALRVRRATGAALADPATLFDLAEVQAEAASLGALEIGQQCAAAIERGVPAAAVDEDFLEEATERLAALLAAADEAPLPQQVELLRCTSRLLQACAAVNGSKVCRRYSRRLQRAADDRELAARIERLLGRTGVVVLETVNFVLLFVVLVVLVLQFTVELSPGQGLVLQWIDACACLFFIADFVFEFVLHPARWSWFLRTAVTDLLPAIPAVLFLLPGPVLPGFAEDAVVLRVTRLLRVTWAARYVRMLRPLLRSARLLLFLVRGMDGLVKRFAQLLNREFVFVPAAVDVRLRVAEDDRRDVLFEALDREHELVALLPTGERNLALAARAAAAAQLARELGPVPNQRRGATSARDVPIDRAIEFLWALRPSDIGRWLRPGDVSALDRVIRVLSSVPIRWLPIVQRFAVHPLPGSPEERIVALARRVAEWLEAWHGRLLFFADLHGIVTGPQLLDRVASAMVTATQRPAVRLLLFGGLFLLFDQLIGVKSDWLSRIVATPLLVLGSFCLVFLTLGRWLKGVAGEASDAYRLTSEAHFITQLELIKPRYEAEDLTFLAVRVFGPGKVAQQACTMLRAQVASARAGVPVAARDVPDDLRFASNRVALLYLHFLDGAPLHVGDVKTTEQLLANQAIDNLRTHFLSLSKRERKQLRRLRLDDGTIFSGPYLWFRFITESIAVECAKRIEGYNRFCVPLAERNTATPAQREAMRDWLLRRVDPKGGRTLASAEQWRKNTFPTTEFTALDFVGADPERDLHIAAMFGDDVLAVVQQDRRTMVREIFGTRPVHHLPKHERSFNPLRFYRRRLSHGRVLAAPLLLVWRFLRSIGWLAGRIRKIVREVYDPELAMQRREAGAAPFGVALRKIHRMKAPGLLAALRMRLRLDPVYSGSPAGWSQGVVSDGESELERDLAFLHLHERERVARRDEADQVRRAVAELHAAMAWLPPFAAPASVEEQQAAELAVTSAWIANKDQVRTLLFAERWRAEVLPVLWRDGVTGSICGDAGRWLRSQFFVHEVDQWLQRHGRDLGKPMRRLLRRAWARNVHEVRTVISAWAKLPVGASPADTAIACLRDVYRTGCAVRRDLQTLRAVQSMAVLDVRNYRDLVFRLGGFAAEGEDPELASALP